MKNLINLSDLTKTDFLKILNHAEILEKNIDNCLENKNIGLIFEKIPLGQGYHFKLA